MTNLKLLNYFISHIVLPKKLPHETTEEDVENEDSFLKLICESLSLVFIGEKSEEIRELLRIFEKWKSLQYKNKVI